MEALEFFQPVEPAWTLVPLLDRRVPAGLLAHHVLWMQDSTFSSRAGLPELRVEDVIECFGTWQAKPMPRLAMAYHGYQFGVLNKGLGDGRAFTWGQWIDAAGTIREIGTKGSGKTPFSRGHDGRLTLASAMREVIASEALAAAGVRTTRCLALIECSSSILREGRPTRSAVLVRTARSLLRLGSFERLLHLGLGAEQRRRALVRLARHCSRHHYPSSSSGSPPSEALAELEELGPAAGWARRLFCLICRATAQMAAGWQAVGFCHGVLNSDNLTICGETLDFGPFSFLEVLVRTGVCPLYPLSLSV